MDKITLSEEINKVKNNIPKIKENTDSLWKAINELESTIFENNLHSDEDLCNEIQSLKESILIVDIITNPNELLDDYTYDLLDYEIEEKIWERGRWSQSISSLLKIQDKYFVLDWEQGLTEMQESYFDKIVEVKHSRVEEKIVYEDVYTDAKGTEIAFRRGD